MKIQGLIFDLDGVLCSTDDYHYLAWKALADHHGLTFSQEINNLLRGVSREDCLKILLEKSKKIISDQEFQACLEEKNNIYLEYLKEMSPRDIEEGVRDTLTYLKTNGYKLAVGSSSKNTKLILAKSDLAKYFDFVSDGTMIKQSKPDPEVFLLAAQGLNLKPKDCIVIEDAASGVEAGLSGGFMVIGIGDSILNTQAEFKIKELAEIKKIIQELN